MRYTRSTFESLLKPIDRRWFAAVVDCHDGDAYDKCFKSWDHLVALIFAQLGHADSLRGLETAFNANAHQHYHLGVGEVARSTLSDASASTCARLRCARSLRAAGFRMTRVLLISAGRFHLFFKHGLRNVFACKSSGVLQ